MILIQEFQEEGWSAGTKPVRSNIPSIQSLYQTERIENIFRILAEMISVVELCQFCQALLIRQSHSLSHSLNIRFHLRG